MNKGLKYSPLSSHHGLGLQIPWSIRGDGSHQERGFEPGRAERELDSVGDGAMAMEAAGGRNSGGSRGVEGRSGRSLHAPGLDARRSLSFTGEDFGLGQAPHGRRGRGCDDDYAEVELTAMACARSQA
jgi:hypothetical protein